MQAFGALVTPGDEAARVTEDTTLKLYVEGRAGFPPPPELDPFASAGAAFQHALATKWSDVEVVIRDGVPVDSVLAAFQREVRARAADLNTQLALRAAEILLDRQQIPSWQIHGVGLEAVEGFGRVLREGMVVAYEPMFTVDEFGFYLEDLLLITSDGYELLTPGLPYSAGEIERAMARQ